MSSINSNPIILAIRGFGISNKVKEITIRITGRENKECHIYLLTGIEALEKKMSKNGTDVRTIAPPKHICFELINHEN